MKNNRFLLLMLSVAMVCSCGPDLDTDRYPQNGNPSDNPSDQPSDNPSDQPSDNPSDQPSEMPDEQSQTIIYYDDLDKAAASGSYLDRWNGYINATGTGAAGVSYVGNYVKTMNTFASTGYPGASGANGFYCGAQNGTILYINDIALPTDGYGKYRFTAGFNVYLNNQNYSPEGYVTLSLSYGTTTKPLTYTVEQYERWYFVTSEFEFAAGVVPSKVSLLITFTTSNIRVDDPKLVWFGQDSGSGTAPGPDESVALKTPYYEYPETLTSSSDYVYGTLRGTTYSSKQNVRNYSYCYDVRRHNPMWVAYPCHDIWWEGGYTRPNPDPWRPNPDLKESQQSVIYAADWNSWPWSNNNKKPSDTYNYWSMTTDGGVMMSMSKGHMMRSAERGAGRSDVLFGMNEQSFYPTNINPERHAYVQVPNGSGTFDLSHWAIVEYMLSDQWKCSDTLYVVVGCWYDKDQHKAIDASNWGVPSSRSKECIVPAGRYKAILRTKSGRTGKKISDCSADELTAIAFWFPQCYDSQNEKTSIDPLAGAVMSVADVEKKIGGGFNFFPDAPSQVKQSYTISDWPGLSDVINDVLNEDFDLKQIM